MMSTLAAGCRSGAITLLKPGEQHAQGIDLAPVRMRRIPIVSGVEYVLKQGRVC